MKSLKKTLVLLVVFSMILSTLVPAFAATDVADLDCEDQVTRMEALGVITGFEDGTFRPNETITRAQMAVIICKMLGINEASAEANKNVASKFSDVAANEWYTGWINIASNNGVIAGFPDGTFRPNETLTLNQVLTLCVKALGRGGYVDKMGTWPANYVTEAARLNLLKDVKGASDANRGTVAVICWNTLNAATWYVNTENLDGEISLSDGINAKTLLAINFNEYTVDEEDEVNGGLKAGALKETDDDVIVVSTPANKSEISDRQIVLQDVATDYAEFGFETNPKKSKKDTMTYVASNDADVVAYVPEDVCEDLDALKGHKVTVVFGEDNVVALIVVEDDVVEKEFITAYDEENSKITVGDVTYKLALNSNDVEDVEVVLNGKSYNTIKDALIIVPGVDASDLEDIEKNIQATLTLDEDGKVEAIDLFASATISGVSYEGVVTEVKETNKKYTIYTTAGDISWEIEDEEDEDLPRVYVDGVRADIRDIEAGNVITVIGNGLNVFNNITTIYVSTETVTGEATKVKKANNAITIDGTVYTATNLSTDKKVTMDDLEDDKWDTFVAATILDNDEVTLYMNVLGEYVAVSITEDTSDYQFGVVTFVSTTTTWEGDDEEIAVKNIKVMLKDGSKKTFKIKLDTDDEDAPELALLDHLKASTDAKYTDILNDFIMFEADADNVIKLEKGNEIIVIDGTTLESVLVSASEEKANADYDVNTVNHGTDKVDGKEFVVGTSDDATCTSKTVIFNKEVGNEEVISSWDSIVNSDNQVVGSGAYVIFEEGDDEALYVVVALGKNDYASSDAEYAIVETKLDEIVDDEFRIDFVGAADVEVKDVVMTAPDTTTEKDLIDYLADLRGWFIKYTTSSSEVNTAKKLIDLDEFAALEDDEIVNVGTDYALAAANGSVIVNPAETNYALATALTGTFTKANLEVAEISIDKDYAAIEYVDGVDNVGLVGEFYTLANGVYTLATEFDDEATYYTVETSALATPMFVDGSNYFTKNASNGYDKLAATDAAYDEDATYYTIAETAVTGAAEDGKTYYTKSGDNYVLDATDVGDTLPSGAVTLVATVATIKVSDIEVDPATTLYVSTSNGYEEAEDTSNFATTYVLDAETATDVDTLGKVRLDDEHLVVIDLRNDEVEMISLSDLVDEEGKLVDNGIYAVLYKNEECANTKAANVVIILD